jgi:hypothetical protein
MTDLLDKFSRGEVENKSCEMMKLWQLQDKIEILGRYNVLNSVICPEKKAFGSFNYTTNSYITTIVIGTTTITVNATKTYAQLVTILTNAGFNSVVVACPNPDSGIFTIYIQSPSCTGYSGVINTLVEDVVVPIPFIISKGCCQVVASTPCLSDEMITNLIGEINEQCYNC